MRFGWRRRVVSVSGRAYRALMVVYPKRFRQEYGGRMVRFFREQCRDAVSSGGLREVAALWSRTLRDLCVSLVRERRSLAPLGWAGRSGVLAVVGGAMILAHGVLLSSYGSEVFRSDPVREAIFSVKIAGELLCLGGILSLIPLLEHGGVLRSLKTAGMVLAGVAAGALLLVLVELLAGGPMGLLANEPTQLALEMVLTFCLPLAVIVLGAVAWKSGMLGRWRILPVVLGFLTSTLPILLVGLLLSLAYWQDGWPVNNLTNWIFFGLPNFVNGLAWILFGYVLWQSAPTPTVRAGRNA